MAALTRPTEANYEVHENVRVDTQGRLQCSFVCSSLLKRKNRTRLILLL